jgi:hypothetical protein
MALAAQAHRQISFRLLESGRLLNQRLFCRPPLQDACPLPDSQSDARRVLDSLGKNILHVPEIIAGAKQAIDLHPVSLHFSTLAEIAVIRLQRLVLFFV